jgi:hypothetical protein
LQSEFPPLRDLILKHYGQTEGEQDSAETSRQTAIQPPFGVRGWLCPPQIAREESYRGRWQFGSGGRTARGQGSTSRDRSHANRLRRGRHPKFDR